jgi:hypothetical protein
MSPTKATDEWHVRHDKKINDTLSILGQMSKAQELAKAKNTQEKPGYHPPGNFRCRGRAAEEAESVVHEEDLEFRSTTARGKTTRRRSSMASSKHHERLPKNPSAGRNPFKTQHLIAKKPLRVSIRNSRIKHVRRNCDWERGLRSLQRMRTSGAPRASTEGPLEIWIHSAKRETVGTPRYKTGWTTFSRQAIRT